MSISSPSRSNVHVNGPLTNLSVAYLQDQSSFVADRVFPMVPVAKQSDAYFEYDSSTFNQNTMEERAPGTESAGETYAIGQNTYYCRVYALHHDIPDQVRANADNPINLDRDATELVTRQGLIKKETTFVDAYFKSGVWSYNVDGAASASASFDPSGTANDVIRWNAANSTPIQDVRFGKRYVLENTGFEPNTLTIGKATYDVLVDHDDIVGRIDRGQTSGAASANLVTLADLFEVDRILVMRGVQANTSGVHSFIGGKHALLSYSPPSAGIMVPSAGYTFTWTGMIGGGNGMRVMRFRSDLTSCDRVEIEMSYDQKLVSKNLGYFFNGIVA